MATMQTDVGVLGYVRALFSGAAVSGMGDAQLLERYRARGDDEAAEHAFAALVHRHGPMVLRACLAVTRDRADAEDAFQATFLVLARRARCLWVRDSLGPWLHAVAVRVASDAQDAADRRRRHERRYAEMAATIAPAGADDGDLRVLLHEEVARLPQKLRAPVVLCDLGGLTHEQAAGQLGWPVGTLKTRLTGARKRLRGCLVRRGAGPAVALIADALAGKTAEAAVPAALAVATVRAARAVCLAKNVATTGVVAASVETLVRRAIKSMILSRGMLAVIALLAAGAVIGGTFACRGLFAGSPSAEKPIDPPTAKGRPMEILVIDKQTGRPVTGANVRAMTGDRDTPASRGTTDPAGHYVVTPDRKTSFLTLHIRAEGYVPVRVDWNSGRTTAPLELPASYTVPLERATSIGGMVKDPEGKPVRGATVFVLIPPGPATEPGVHPRVDIWEEPCATDAQGRWRFALVPADLKTPWLRGTHRDFVSKAVIDDDPSVLVRLRDGSHVLRLEPACRSRGGSSTCKVSPSPGRGWTRGRAWRISCTSGSRPTPRDASASVMSRPARPY